MQKLRQILFVPPAPLLWAGALDAFRQLGVEVETTHTLSSDEIGQGLADGRWDLGMGVMDNVIAWNDTFGADLQIVAQLERTMELRFVCPVGVDGMAQVAREPIAVDATTNGFVMVLYRALARANIAWRDCRLDPVGGVRQRYEALVNATATSTILIPPFDAMLQERGFHVLWSNHDIAPDYPGVVVAARRSCVERLRPELVRYLRAVLRANRWAQNPKHRQAATEALLAARHTPESAQRLLAHAMPDLLPAQAGWLETLRLRAESGLMPDPAPGFDQVVNQTLLREAIEAEERGKEARPS